MSEKKIKDIYNCEYIVSDEELYPLQKWHNILIDKTVSQISIADVLRMLRQKELPDLAMSLAIKFLRDDIFAGELWEGEMLEQISKMDSSFLKEYKKDLKLIIEDALIKSSVHEWTYDGEEKEFRKVMDDILIKIGQ
ncbi:MAG: contact-dependent growth inhibition system immunity protein [Eubacteriales bacterium]|nr:contact-dependent growth inhibition system immunity protein [Eubacteriales bacterium]